MIIVILIIIGIIFSILLFDSAYYGTHKYMNKYTTNRITFYNFLKEVIKRKNEWEYDKKYNSLFIKWYRKGVNKFDYTDFDKFLKYYDDNKIHAYIVKFDGEKYIFSNLLEFLKYFLFIKKLKYLSGKVYFCARDYNA